MKAYDYLIVGGGMTAASAVEGIREKDEEGTIAVISAEANPPYDRPPLTKGLWKGKKLKSIWRDTPEYNIDIYLGTRVTRLMPENKRVEDENGEIYNYGKLLLATGGQPKRLPGDTEGVIYFRTLEDYLALANMAKQGGRFVVVGGGFIGSELAAALRMNDQDVTMIISEEGVGAKIFPKDLSQHITGYYKEKGVKLLTGQKVNEVLPQKEGFLVKTSAGESVEADHVVVGIGIQPNVELAEAAGIEVDDGIRVGEFLQTNLPDIYAAGDVARFPLAMLGGNIRFEHEDNANTMGHVAGRLMAGGREPYKQIPMFYSDLFDLGYEAVGILDASLRTVEDWYDNAYKKGVVYYLDGETLRGVLLWNVWDKVDAARELILTTALVGAGELKGSL